MATTVETLDTDITTLNTKLSLLRARRAHLTSVLLSLPHLSSHLQHHQKKTSNSKTQHQNATRAIQHQTILNLTSTHRACAGITAYKVRDPDPNAIDNGSVLGVRIDVSIPGKFVETYNVLLHRPNADASNGEGRLRLKIHKHSLPPCIPVQALADRYLPQSAKGVREVGEQQLVRFGKVLRREVVGWHLRSAALLKLRGEAGLLDTDGKEKDVKGKDKTPTYGKILNAFVSDDEDSEDEGIEQENDERPVRISEIGADLSVRHIEITWSDRQTASLEVGKDGEIGKGVVRTKDGTRVREIEKRVLGRIEGLVGRLAE